ncbi:MAG: flagellar protein FlgN [Desulfatiglans sp.]|nr:flagellar protein FlgN [Thermodesulfobacteriota bacterium]MEE4354442.1 flagellar protein FlgN [Desulfatiglans sp.]
MDLLLDRLLDILAKEKDLYERLLVALKNEKRAVVDSRLDSLNEATKEKENLLLKIRILEEQRSSNLARLAQRLGESPEDLTLTRLSQLLEEPYAAQVADASSEFSTLIQRIHDINKNNKALIQHSLELVRGSLTLLNDLVPSSPVYHKTGRLQAGSYSGKVLSGSI